jgi:ABC-type branched-subunit amino acid transport system substrate-binding protein
MLTATNRFFEINSKVKSIAVFCDSSQRGSAFSLMLRDVARSRQVRILYENCSSEVGSDNRAGVLRAQAENPDAVIIDRDLEQILNLMQKFGWGAPVLTTNLLADVLARGTSPPGLVDGVFSVGWNIESSFVRKFQGTYGVVPNFTAALAYDAIQLAAVSYASSPDDMRAGLKRIRSQGVAGRYDFTVEQAGNGQQAKLLRLSQGAPTEQ